MNRCFICLLCLGMLALSHSAASDLNEYRDTTDQLWRRGAGAEDGAFSAISASMLGWGLGLAAVAAILASVLHQSAGGGGGHAHAHSSCP